MGGLVARLFLQSSEYNHTYHKLITLNSPHSGTQVVDFASKNPVIFSLAALVGGGSSPAFVDLGVNSQGTNNVNGANLNKNIVPTHAIVSDYNILDNNDVCDEEDNWRA
jgi:triacylglycerol esterase/lipase EstA (alpha/beta hydrolase family)